MAQRVEITGAQLREDVRSPADAAGVFGQSDVAHMMQGVVDDSTVAHGVVSVAGRESMAADVSGRFAARLPEAQAGIEDVSVASYLDKALNG